VQLRFSRSATYDLNSFGFTLRINLGKAAHHGD
jgi:hypothetical protein